jgi:DNA-directed RNA polymerase beta subunit
MGDRVVATSRCRVRQGGTASSLDRRYGILREFFRHHGWLADIPKDYAHYVTMMAELVNGHVDGPLAGIDECIKGSTTYEYAIIVGGSTICTVPAMTDKGYFVIQGQEKVVMVQEVRLQTEQCVTYVPPPMRTPDSANKGRKGGPCCELFIDGATVPARVRIADDSVVELDTAMVHKDLRDISSIGMLDVINDLFSEEDRVLVYNSVSYMLRSYCAEHADACMAHILSSSRGAGGLSIDEDRETIRWKIFGGMSNNCIIATLVTMTAACVIAALGFASPSDRDDYSMKRLKTPGATIYKIFRYCVNTCRNPKNLNSLIYRHVHSFIKRGEITVAGRAYSKMSMQLSKRSYVDMLSSVRRVVVPCDENSPNTKMRQIHASQKGYVCPCETPEGKAVGIIKSLGCCCIVSTKTDIGEWVSKACRDGIFAGGVWAIVDGAVVGWCTPEDVGQIKVEYPTVSVTMPKANIARIRTSSGRPLRPLLVTRKHPVDWNRVGSFDRMLSSGLLEYLDPAECTSSTIASIGYEGDWTRFTHIEIHPCTMLGLAASMIPFPEHNQSARNVFSSAMIKQAMQLYGSEGSGDKTCDYLQRPLVYTQVSRDMGCDSNPNGVNLVTCMMAINGYNQEDAIILKKSSIERGLFSSVARHTTSVTIDNPWSRVDDDDSGCVSILHGRTERTLVDVKSMMPSPRITAVKESVAESGRSRIDVSMDEHRFMQLGDKMSSRHAQKGVVGLIMAEEDMPFTASGMVPDIIINPHAIPSRMTVGQLLEGVLGKHAAMTGTFKDGTPFLRAGMEDLCKTLKMSDTEAVILGTTGESVQTPVAIGIVYYMALRHQAVDKVYVRSTGPKSIMSRQPISGRSKGGALRLGEMEYDCLIAHGASRLVTGVSENSDMADVPYCTTCNAVTDVFAGPCRLCGSETVRRRMPFSYVVFKDLMLAANIQVHTML